MFGFVTLQFLNELVIHLLMLGYKYCESQPSFNGYWLEYIGFEILILLGNYHNTLQNILIFTYKLADKHTQRGKTYFFTILFIKELLHFLLTFLFAVLKNIFWKSE